MSIRDPDDLLTYGDENFDFLMKIVLIGDCATGKTCVVQRFRSGTFIERHGNTIGVDFSMKTVSIDGKKVKVSINNYFILFFFSSQLINHSSTSHSLINNEIVISLIKTYFLFIFVYNF